MDEITTAIITSLASGIGNVGKKLMSDAYGALKLRLTKKFGQNSEVATAIKRLEAKPESKTLQDDLENRIANTRAVEDPILMQLAQTLLKEIANTPDGKVVLEKYRIKSEKIGVVGDNVRINGGQHF